MSTLWGEMFGGANVAKLKEKAYEFKRELDSTHGIFSWYRKTEIKSKLIRILDEIDYQEGRLQFANRPYSKPSAGIKLRRCTRVNSCACGCWGNKREEFFRL